MANCISSRLNLARRLVLAVVAIMALTTGSTSASAAQSLAAAHPAVFEVASVRPNSVWKSGGEGNSRSKIEFTPDRLTMRNVDLSECIQWAYGVQFYRISGLISLKPNRYDISAKAEGPVPVSQLEAMLQDLRQKDLISCFIVRQRCLAFMSWSLRKVDPSSLRRKPTALSLLLIPANHCHEWRMGTSSSTIHPCLNSRRSYRSFGISIGPW